MRTTIARRTAASLLAGALLLSGCAGDDATSSADPTTADATTDDAAATSSEAPEQPGAEVDEASFPVTVEAGNGPVTVEQRPDSIVSISPTATEILFAIDAGEQVVAVDDFSTFPPEAPVTDLSGFQPNVEAILGHEPDLVVLAFDPGDVVAGLEAAGVPAIVHDAAVTLEDTYIQIEQLGAVTGNAAAAAEVVAGMQADLDELVASLPEGAEGLTYYHELDNTYFSATSSTFIGELYGLFGLENIADAADPEGESFGFPQLSAEYVVEADPDLIFLADTKCCQVTAESVAARDGWESISAVRNGAVVELDDDVASRWGPRVVDLLERIAQAIDEVVAERAAA